ncbi:Endonuclease-reverse transcriptase [Popillia japonica]|uniref:Endonuclease-reverse transcriptase n=1 Tax=Popillia japonica TaxID=7064 RepID=A0AAW1KJ71_POPJA
MISPINSGIAGFTLAASNACGVRDKKDELALFLVEQNLDVALISETWLRPVDSLRFPNYCTYRADRLTGRNGGVAVLVKKNLHHRPLYVSGLHFVEAVGIEISIRGLGPLKVFSVYAPPGRDCDWTDLDLLLSADAPALAAGDFNAKHRSWGCRVANGYRGKLFDYLSTIPVSLHSPNAPTFFRPGVNGYGGKLFDYLSTIPVSLHSPNAPTFFRPGVRPDILDIAISKNIPTILEVQVLAVLAELSSDHTILSSFPLGLGVDRPTTPLFAMLIGGPSTVQNQTSNVWNGG